MKLNVRYCKKWIKCRNGNKLSIFKGKCQEVNLGSRTELENMSVAPRLGIRKKRNTAQSISYEIVSWTVI